MLGLVAFALLILASSYWKLTGYLENRGEADEDGPKPPPVLEEKYLVIMAGQEKPSFLATPSRVPSFSSTNYFSENSICH
ncbi:protein glutamine dumper 3 [Phtheirospermum japonicum]|uniref:Protein glutamine dumper 3 n=1 Tax=Phtheirospermum japonicum TaxID=374723 RepID=A0A830C628_9LAMI|nr:protein glutamine dumper 3 [Phtheirospermum japonicum]